MSSDFENLDDDRTVIRGHRSRGSHRLEAPTRTGCALGFGWTIGVMLALILIPLTCIGSCVGLGGFGLVMSEQRAKELEKEKNKEQKAKPRP